MPLWVGCRLLRVRTRTLRPAALAALFLLLVVWVLPIVTMSYGGQIIYHRIFHSYMGRDTLRLGIALRGTVRDWFVAWGGPWLMGGMLAGGLVITWGLFKIIRTVPDRISTRFPVAPAILFAAAMWCFWTDNVDSRFMQAAVPDACFVHSVVHAARMAITGSWNRRQGVSLRTPAPLPHLASRTAHPPNVLLIITESVRADATCSDPPPVCRSAYLDQVVPDRIALGKLATQTPNTFSASILLWNGAAPNSNFIAMHSAPVLWELAKAIGYRTAYVSAQNPEYEDFGMFTHNAGIDVLISAMDLGGLAHEQLGAPDERATEQLLRFAQSVPAQTPYFAVLHLSNTHAPYRIDPEVMPYKPVSSDPLGNIDSFRNRYLDSVRLQERTIAELLEQIRALPSWSNTAVILVSDHGEQFREHGGLYHNHSLAQEELRIPGWISAGREVLSYEQKRALGTYAGHYTYMQDVHETVVDLFGLEESRISLPYASLVGGRSLLRNWTSDGKALLATSTAVWEPDDARFGAMWGDFELLGDETDQWTCFNLREDPEQRNPRAPEACGDLLAFVRHNFAASLTKTR